MVENAQAMIRHVKTELPTSLFRAIESLIVRENVQSVSCPLTDYFLWRLLVGEQLKRAERTGMSPQAAFTLSGPDSGLRNVPYEDWGGKVHIPYEGACGADLFVKPAWRRTFPEADARGGSLSDVLFGGHFGECVETGDVCQYLLANEDLGHLRCAHRVDIGDGWILYESNRPYQPNRLFKDAPRTWP